MLLTAIDVALAVLAGVIAIATILPFWQTHLWWVRALDFPRFQILAVAAVGVVLALLFADVWRWPVIGVITLCAIYQGIRILPYTALYPREMREVPRRTGGKQLSILSSNIEMTNDRHDDVAKMIADVDADVVFLMETDDTWASVLKEALSGYSEVLEHPKDNYYGLIFATRLKVRSAEVVYLTKDDTPTLFADLEAPDGTPFRLIGLHPRPPVPGNDTQDRDAEMIYSARFAHETDMPLIVVGDFNDAAWSDTSRRFKKVGEYCDPRVGRGMVASFHAKSRLLRAPIDQFYATPNVAVVEFYRERAVGSDHFPMVARIDVDAELAARNNRAPPPIEDDHLEEIERVVARHREALAEVERD